MAHLADQNLRDVPGFECRCAREQLAQRVELALARVAPLDSGDRGEFFVELTNRERGFGVGRAKLERHLHGLAEVFGGGKDVFALVCAVGHLRDDFPDCAAADFAALLLAQRDRAADHESRRDFRFVDVELGQKCAYRLGHLKPALRLAERLADDCEVVKRGHVRD